MWQGRGACAFTVVAVAGRSNFTSYFYSDAELLDAEQVTTLRVAESTHALRLLGGRHVVLDELEAPLRCHAGPCAAAAG